MKLDLFIPVFGFGLVCAGAACALLQVQVVWLMRNHRTLLSRLDALTPKGSAQKTVHIPPEWQDQFLVDVATHEANSKKLNLAKPGPLEDQDTVSALPPFVQTIPKHNSGPTTTLAE